MSTPLPIHFSQRSASRLGLLAVAAIFCAGCLPAAAAAPATPIAPLDFASDVRPILASHCFKCHGQDEAARKAKLRLDVRDDALRPAKSEKLAIVPGKPEQSELITRIFTADEDELMPPAAAKNPLTPADKEILKRWIAAGAEYKPHWAFIAPQQAALPKVSNSSWPRNAIDHFVLARLEKEGLTPSAPADKYTLLRRVCLDLTGLPPTPAQTDAFVRDASPDAYEKVVDKLLASPAYGERWARRWLDLARYADTNGYEKDRPRSIWAWRDWVIKALNADMPFDEFTVEQLAGDMLPHATRDQIIATGFHRNTMLNEEGGIDPLEYRFYSMVDRVHVTSTAWLGLTMACAQCHTHKYDPILHTEYYGFMAFMNNAVEPTLPLTNAEVAAQRKSVQEKIDRLTAQLPDKFPVESKIVWQPPAAATFVSEQGNTAEFLPDGSFLVTATKPERDTYTVKFDAPPQRVTHLKLEVLLDQKLATGGPGLAEGGNFVLNELEAELPASDDNRETKKIKFANAKADFSQKNYADKNAIDGKPETGWAVAGAPGKKKSRDLVLTLAEPLELKKATTITVRLVQTHGKQHILGRFRISLGDEPLESNISAERRRELRDAAFQKWVTKQLPAVADWKMLPPTSATSAVPILTLQEDGSVFASGDFTKNDTYTLTFRRPPAGLKAIRLEMIADERLPNGGPGSVSYEGPEGDFWLSNLKAFADGAPLTFTNATEDFANGKNNAANAIDDDLQSGWSIAGGQGKTHNAVFQFTESVTSTNELRLELTCEKHYAAGLGRFRIWVTTANGVQATALGNDALAVLEKLRREKKLEQVFAGKALAKERDVLMQQFALLAPDFAKARQELENLRKEMPRPPTTLVMQERPPGHERPTFRQHRGEFLQPKEAVAPHVPAFLPPLPPEQPQNRLTLARWLVSGENPLTGRVVMNRHWEAFFGRGLVRTTEDFGFQGELPSHPELLDWLAVEFVKQGWSQKKMHRLIVMSATYRQASDLTPQLRERDPANVLLARGPRFRLEAEMVRDAALVASGLLTDKIGGPSVYPPQPAGVSSEGAFGALDWTTSEGPDRYRRGLYTFAKRTTPYAMTATFDAPSGEACLARRERANTPLQALTLLNDTVFMEAARALGALAVQADGDTAQRIELIFRRCLTRPPAPTETERLKKFYEAQLARFASGDLKATEVLDSKPGNSLNEQAAWTTLARALLNLDETITKN